MIKKLSPKYQVWIDARKRYNLSHMHVQMARELALNPKKLGKMANSDPKSGKLPLTEYIESLYKKNYHKTQPDTIRSIEQIVTDKKRKKVERKARKKEYIADGSKSDGIQTPLLTEHSVPQKEEEQQTKLS